MQILAGATNIIGNVQDQMDLDTRKKIFAVFQTGADRGNATSMRNLGFLYRKVLEWRRTTPRRASGSRRPPTRATRAPCEPRPALRDGQGVVQDYAKAREWFEKAADKGDAVAMGMTRQALPNGQGVAQDYAKAREWYEKAADKDDTYAMGRLGRLYTNGQGVAQDYAKAREWYEKAAAEDNEIAMGYLGLFTRKVLEWRRTTTRRASGTRKPLKRVTRAPRHA